MNAKNRLSFAIVCALAGAGAGSPERSYAAEPTAQEQGLEEIVVTARKREERLQDVPIAVTAVTADTLEREQVNTIREIAAYAPGLNITTDAVGRAFMSIRGVGTTLYAALRALATTPGQPVTFTCLPPGRAPARIPGRCPI